MINRESMIFCSAAAVVTVAVCAIGFSLAALPRAAIDTATKPAAAQDLPDVDLGAGFGKVSVIELVGYYIENPPAPQAAGGDAAPALKRFGGC